MQIGRQRAIRQVLELRELLDSSESAVLASESDEAGLSEQTEEAGDFSRKRAHHGNIAKVTQKHDIVDDHWWHSPLTLAADEVAAVVNAASYLVKQRLECDTETPVGRSGAALLVLTGAEDSQQYFIRVTSRWRSCREAYALTNIFGAKHLLISGKALTCELPMLRRHFPVSMTLVPFMEGDDEIKVDQACAQFSRLFESPTSWRSHAVPRIAQWPLVRLGDLAPQALRGQIRTALHLIRKENWLITVGHGDPHPENLRRTGDSTYLPVDFAGGGLVLKRLHRARWVNAVHRNWQPFGAVADDCSHCLSAGHDYLALLIDATRRFHSESRDPLRSKFWSDRVTSLLEAVTQ